MVTLGTGFWVTALALAFGIWQGGTVSLLRADLAFRYDGEMLMVQADPVFIVRGSDLREPCGAKITAAAFGNAIFWANYIHSVPRDLNSLALQHELNHVYQFRALGPFFLLGCMLLPIEGDPHYYRQETLAQCNATMWLPPKGWPNLAPFLIVERAITN